MKILVVDDSTAFAKTTAMMLEVSKHQVMTAASISEALAAASLFIPEVVLIDRHLQDGDGLVLADELRGMQETKDARLILVSGDPPSEAERRRLDAFILKPPSRANLLEAIGRARPVKHRRSKTPK